MNCLVLKGVCNSFFIGIPSNLQLCQIIFTNININYIIILFREITFIIKYPWKKYNQ